MTINEESVFAEAMVKQSPHERAVFLDHACAGNPGLRQSVESLLSAYDDGQFLEAPAPGLDATMGLIPTAEQPGAEIGPYKLLEQIGEGGMGLVFMADQLRPVRRRVALKIIKPGMDSQQVIARFEAERQALALMDHPNIAKIFDAGTTDESEPRTQRSGVSADGADDGLLTPLRCVRGSGRPYFAMELVRGIPITDYCDEHKLAIRQRLELFVQVCQAVQHAHQKGVIHRDLKPTNVLVAHDDTVPLPKIIDFGIAKATSQPLTERTLFTALAQVVGTPLYMSPEQAALNHLDVDTRTDVYSLGVLLYELLTGTTPFDGETLRKAGLDEMRRIIREDEPPRPSMRVSTLGASLTTVSQRRSVDPRRISVTLRGDLDWIVMKALEKDRNRRYESASAFAADVQRYLDDAPVEACPPSRIYRLRKFAWRNRLLLITGGAVAAALLVGSGISVWQAIEAEKARVLAQQRFVEGDKERQLAEENFRLARQAVDDMYTQVAETWLTQEPHLTAIRRDFLEKAESYYEQLSELHGTDPQLRQSVGEANRRVAHICNDLEQFQKCEEACQRAVSVFEDLVADFPEVNEYRHQLSLCYTELGWLLSDTGRLPECESAHRQAVTLSAHLLELLPDDPAFRCSFARSIICLGDILRDDPSRYEEAREAYERGVSVADGLVRQFPGNPEYRNVLASGMRDLAGLLTREDPVQCESLLVRSVALFESLSREFPNAPSYRHHLASVYSHLGNIYRDTDRLQSAKQLYRMSMTTWEKLAADYPLVMDYQASLGRVYDDWGNQLRKEDHLNDAEEYLQKSLDLRQQWVAAAPDRPGARDELAHSYNHLGELMQITGRFQAAGNAYWQAIALSEGLVAEFPTQHRYQDTLSVGYRKLARLLVLRAEPELRDPVTAVQLARKAIDLSPSDSGCWATLSIASYYAGDSRAAIVAFETAEDLQPKVDRPWAGFVQAMAHWQLGNKDEARRWYETSVEWMQKSVPNDELKRLRDEAAKLIDVNQDEG